MTSAGIGLSEYALTLRRFLMASMTSMTVLLLMAPMILPRGNDINPHPDVDAPYRSGLASG